jgi:hypothetical protein
MNPDLISFAEGWQSHRTSLIWHCLQITIHRDVKDQRTFNSHISLNLQLNGDHIIRRLPSTEKSGEPPGVHGGEKLIRLPAMRRDWDIGKTTTLYRLYPTVSTITAGKHAKSFKRRKQKFLKDNYRCKGKTNRHLKWTLYYIWYSGPWRKKEAHWNFPLLNHSVGSQSNKRPFTI